MYEYFLLCLIIAFAGFTQGFSGFGAVLVSLPCLTLLLPIKTVVPLVNLMSCCINLILIIQLRRHLQWPKILPLLLASLPGIPLGVYFLKTVAPWKLELLLGAVLISFPFYSRYTRTSARSLHQGWAYLAGFCSGCLGGSLGTNGPPIIIYTALQPWDKDEMKATLVGFFFIAHLGAVGFQAFSGLVTAKIVTLVFGSLPFLALGVFCGSFCYTKTASESYRKIITVMLFAMGLFLMVKAAQG
ncbi:MAG: sulfite exporter TauE/SafE family protein [Desulfobaccales bacterium]